MRGQISLLVIIFMVLLFLFIFWFIPKQYRNYNSLIVIESIKWKDNEGKNISVVESNQLVKVIITLSINGEYIGYITFKVRKDVRFLPDKDVAFLRQYYILRDKEKITITLSFIAEKSLLTRGYFVEIDWKNKRYVMPNSYPPRLRVIP